MQSFWNHRWFPTPRKMLVFFGLLGVLLLQDAGQAAPPTKQGILFWIRKDGDHSIEDVKVEKIQPRWIQPKRRELRVWKRKDLQVQKRIRVRGILLDRLIQQYNPPTGLDLALLHFENGVIIPYAWRYPTVSKKLRPLVAFSWKSPSGWSTVFPMIQTPAIPYTMQHPIRFEKNKILVATLEHPGMDKRILKSFSPWQHVGSLLGVEFVHAGAYYKQFTVKGGAEIQKGFELFKRNCQYCHGAREVGAKRGWDFVRPLPVYEHRRNAKRLFNHIKYRITGEQARMPALPHMTLAEARALWLWLRAIAKQEMPPYKRY